MNEAYIAIKDGMARKLSAARKMIDHDKEMAAGIYIYAVEELVKLELLKSSQKIQGCSRIDYAHGFLAHKVKFLKAAQYLKEHNHPECIDVGGSFSKTLFTDSFTKELETSTVARLGIFYIDFEIDDRGTKARKFKAIPYVGESSLVAAIDGMENAMRKYT